MNTATSPKKACILGATGCIGFELTAHLLQSGCQVLAVVRDKSKLRQLLSSRGMDPDIAALSVVELDLFADGGGAGAALMQEMMTCDIIFNAASKPISWNPWSRTNREWGSIVSCLTKDIVRFASESTGKPHVVAFCGPEYFSGYDENISYVQKFLPKLINGLIDALRDNHEEARFLLTSGYERWSVLRCGSIRPASGNLGDASRIGMDFHKDRSDYRKGKGKSLIIEDLAAYLATSVQSGKFSDFEGQMPFLFNTQF